MQKELAEQLGLSTGDKDKPAGSGTVILVVSLYAKTHTRLHRRTVYPTFASHLLQHHPPAFAVLAYPQVSTEED